MRVLTRYLCWQIIQSTALVVLVLMAVEGLLEFISQLSDIGTVHYSIIDAFIFVIMQLPADLYQLFPMAGFLGCLMGLGKLASTSQLTVIRASGVSKRQIAWIVIQAAILMMLFVTVLGEFVAPSLQAKSQQIKSGDLKHITGIKALQNVWLRDGKQFVHFGQVKSDTEVQKVSLFEINDHHRLLSAARSDKASLKNGQWNMLDAQQSVFRPGRVISQSVVSLPLGVVFNPVLLQEGDKSAVQQSIAGLLKAIHYRKKAGLNTIQYEFSLWQRIIKPITAIIMICLGVPFIFGSLRSASLGLRVLVGVMVGFGFYMLNQFFGPFAILFHVPPIVAALTPTVIFALGCVILLRRSV